MLNKLFNIKKSKTKAKKDQLFLVLSLLIVLLAAFLRFYRFNQRWGIHFDPARDAIVGSQAIKLRKLPLIGSFSSAGPFVFGPILYYLIIVSYLILPNLLIAPWIFYTIINALYSFVMLKAGQTISKNLGLITGLFAAISQMHVQRANGMNQHNLVAITTALTLLSFLLYYKNKKLKYLFFLGISIGLTLSLHYQAFNIFLFIPFAIFIHHKKNIISVLKKALLIALGIFIISIPMVYWDYAQGWKNFLNLLDYFLIGQYRIFVSERWLNYIFNFWPQFWSDIIGTEIIIGYLLIATTAIITTYLFIKKKLPKQILMILIIFIIQIFMIRYYHGLKDYMYLHFFQPMVIFFSGYTIYNLKKINKTIGYSLLILVVLFTLKADIKIITTQTNLIKPITTFVQLLKMKMPGKKYRLFDYKYIDPTPSVMSSLFLSFENLIDEKNGTRLGFSAMELPYQQIAEIDGIDKKIYVYDITKEWNTKYLKQRDWLNVSPTYIYYDITEWWKVKEFKSSFCLSCYIKGKLRLN